MEVVFDGVEAFVVPAGENFGAGALFERDVDVDGLGLADAVEAADALLEQLGVVGEVEEDEVVGELEVAAFAADLGADEDAGAVGFGEEGGVAVALEEREAFVEDGGGDGDLLEEGFVGLLGEFAGAANEEDLRGVEGAQEVDKPGDAGDGEGSEVGAAVGETGEGGAGVAEHDATGAEAVEEVGEVAGGCVFGDEGFSFLGDLSVVIGFFDEGVEVAVAVGVEEAEAAEVAFEAELLGGGGEEEDGGDGGGEAGGEVVGGTGGFEVVRFVDDEEVPTGGDGLVAALGGIREEGGAGDDELAVEKGVGSRVAGFDGDDAFLVEEVEEEVEPAEEFDEPLVNERVGEDDEDAVGAAGEVEAVENEAGFDGLAEADFVGEEDAGGEAAGDLGGDVNLVGDEVDAGAGETADGGLADAGAVREGANAEVEGGKVVGATGKEAVFGGAEADGVGEFGLGDGAVSAVGPDGVGRDAVGTGGDRFDGELFVRVRADLVAGTENDAAERGGFERVLAVLGGGGEVDFDATEFGLEQDAEAEFGFGVGGPALAGLDVAGIQVESRVESLRSRVE